MSLSLPPQVKGPVTGEIKLTIDRVIWNGALGAICAKVAWWGEIGGGKFIFLS